MSRPVVCRSCFITCGPSDLVAHLRDCHGSERSGQYLNESITLARCPVVPLEDIISSQALFERFVQQQIGRGSDRSDLLGVMQAWPDASQTVSWLIVQSQLATNDTDALDLLMEAILTGSEAAHEILTMNLLAADLLHRRKRFLDAQRLLELARSLLVHRVDLCRIDSALGLLSRRHAVRVTPSIIMLPHMEVAISERARVAEHFSECRRPTDEEVRFFRDPFDGYEIDLLIDGDQHEALSEVRLGAYARYLTDGECLHVVVGDIANIGYHFHLVGGLRVVVHSDTIPMVITCVADPGSHFVRPDDPLPAGTRLSAPVCEEHARVIVSAFPWVRSIWCTRSDVWLGVYQGTLVSPFEYPKTVGGLTVRIRKVDPIYNEAGRPLYPPGSPMPVHDHLPDLRPGYVVRHSPRMPTTCLGVRCSWNGEQYLTCAAYAWFPVHPYQVNAMKTLIERANFVRLPHGSRQRRLRGKRLYHCSKAHAVGQNAHMFDDITNVFNSVDCKDNEFDVALIRADSAVSFSNVVDGVYLGRIVDVDAYPSYDVLKHLVFFVRFDMLSITLSLVYVGIWGVLGVNRFHPKVLHFRVVGVVPANLKLGGICGSPVFDRSGTVYGFARIVNDALRQIAVVPIPPGLTIP